MTNVFSDYSALKSEQKQFSNVDTKQEKHLYVADGFSTN